MTAVAIIVEYQTPDLLELCLASLKRFAPSVLPLLMPGGPGAERHAAGIEAAREILKASPVDRVILLDTDTVILSARWAATLTDERFHLIGGRWDRKGGPFLHAHCLSLSWWLFCAVPSFQGKEGSMQFDTAWQATNLATLHRVPMYVISSRPDGRITEYVDGCERPLWRHLGRGTSFRPRSWEREILRKLAAKLGSPRARKILSYQQDRQEFLRKGWEIVRA